MIQPHDFVPLQAKVLILKASDAPLSLEYWEGKLNIPPLTHEEKARFFVICW